MLRAEFTGVLRGDTLADAYAQMDIFAFPSETDTAGNAVLEAMASGVPAVVMVTGGQRFVVETERTAIVADGPDAFVQGFERSSKIGGGERRWALPRGRMLWSCFRGIGSSSTCARRMRRPSRQPKVSDATVLSVASVAALRLGRGGGGGGGARGGGVGSGARFSGGRGGGGGVSGFARFGRWYQSAQRIGRPVDGRI